LRVKQQKTFEMSTARACVWVALLLVSASCQSTNGFYQGTVQDEDGKPLEDVSVTGNRYGQAVRTDSKGYFRLDKQEVGEQVTLIFSKSGYATDTIPLAFHQDDEAAGYRFIAKDTLLITLRKNIQQVKTGGSRTGMVAIAAPVAQAEVITVGTEVSGDFDGDGQIDHARQALAEKGQGNAAEEGTPDKYFIDFPESSEPPIPADCCEFRLVNEGDLNGDGSDELSVFQAPINGCTYTMYTYSFHKGNWHQLISPFLIPTACAPFSNETLQQRIFLEQGTVYYYETDANDEGFRLIKTKATLNN
jgi:hypothetical protein